MHNRQLPMADQDILNAIFGYSPWYTWDTLYRTITTRYFRYLYELPCVWNYILWQCREMPEFWYGKNLRGNKNMCPGNNMIYKVVYMVVLLFRC